MSFLLFAIVTGFFLSDESDGQTRICYYETIEGTYAETIDVTEICDITIEVEI